MSDGVKIIEAGVHHRADKPGRYAFIKWQDGCVEAHCGKFFKLEDSRKQIVSAMNAVLRKYDVLFPCKNIDGAHGRV